MKQKNIIFAQMLIIGIYVQNLIKIYTLLVQISVEIIYVKILCILISHYFVIFAKI